MATPKASDSDATTPDSTTETTPAPAQPSDSTSSSPDSSPVSGPTDAAATDGSASADGGTSTAEGSAADQAATGPDETIENPHEDATSTPDGLPRIEQPAAALPPEEPIKNPEPEEQATTEPDVVQGNGDTIFRGGIRVLEEGVSERVFYCETCAAEGKAREALAEDELAEHAAEHGEPGVVIL